MEAVVAILTNSIGMADSAGWVAHVIVEALVESPAPVDIMQYVNEAAANHRQIYSTLRADFDKLAANSSPPDKLVEYVGTYRHPGALDFQIEIRTDEDSGLLVAFQGLGSQTWDLKHLEGDTFHWLTSRDYQAKKASFTYLSLYNLLKISFRRD